MYQNNRNDRGFSRGRSFSSRSRRPFTGSVNVSQYIKKAAPVVEEISVVTHKFTDFGLDSRIIQEITAKGYITPTPIQDRSIPVVMDGRDMIGIADTGTGKTAAFLLPLVNKLLKSPGQKTLIVVPTRELATQIDDELRSFSKGMRIFSAVCVGGTGIGGQIAALRRNPQFIIGTPGRLKDHLSRKTLRLYDVANLVLDEADRMLDMGFVEDIRNLISQLPKDRQSLFFSATITPAVQSLINTFTNDAQMISVKNQNTSQNVDQDVIRFSDTNHKLTLLHDLLIKDECDKVLIFGRTKHGVEKLKEVLVERGFQAQSIHGNKNQAQRQRSLNEFKHGQTKILVATDVAARGIDVPNVSHVINYDLPENYADYVHRIGRTGRANQKGKALTFIAN